jgi:ankyrin repeat protein
MQYRKGYTEIVKELILLGANVEATTTFHNTPLHVAASNGHTNTVTELVQLGAKCGGNKPL